MVICIVINPIDRYLTAMNFLIKTRISLAVLLLSCCAAPALAQKPFMEGEIVYKVQLESKDKSVITGTYTFIIKGEEVRKEIKLNNGYQDVIILNCGSRKAFSLQSRNGKKYAIELNMAELAKEQTKFEGFGLNGETKGSRSIAGYPVLAGNVSYHDGSVARIYYTKEWQPSQSLTFERFPDAHFLPMDFFYKDEHGMIMKFEAEKIQPGPVENAVFRVPHDYKLISYSEYKELNR